MLLFLVIELLLEFFFECGADVSFGEEVCFDGDGDFGCHLSSDSSAVFIWGSVDIGVLVDDTMFRWVAAFFFEAEKCFFCSKYLYG